MTPRGLSLRRNGGLLGCALLLLLALPGQAERKTVVRIGSKNFSENRILAHMLGQLVEAHTEFDVEMRDNLGGTLLVFEALKNGQVDMYPEYTGTGWAIVLKKSAVAEPLRTYTAVAAHYREEYDLAWLSPFGFSNSYAIAVRKEIADAHNLKVISDLEPHSDELRVAVSHEFLKREDGWPGLSKAYGLSMSSLRGMDHGLAYEAIKSEAADVVDTWTTDGKLKTLPLVVLKDDRSFFPPYHCTPLVRRALLRAHPELEELLDRLAFRIDNATMQALNAEVELDKRAIADVARKFLQREGLLSGAEAKTFAQPSNSNRPGLNAMLRLLLEHILLCCAAMFLAIVVAVPLGISLRQRPRLSVPVVNATGILQTIPSLALLAFMIPIPGLGLGSRSAVTALFLYSLLPILRNTVTGLRGVSPQLLEAAEGIGLTSGQRLRLVELPLALPTIMAGIRTAAVISIGVATLAAFIGAGGLGEPIITGLQLNDTTLIFYGAVPAALLAIVTDTLLGIVEKLVGKTRSSQGRS